MGPRSRVARLQRRRESRNGAASMSHEQPPSQTGGEDAFQCYNCGRHYRWKPEISGKSLRCKCGNKVRCPELHDDTLTAHESLDDTVADVDLSQVLDSVEVEDDAPVGADADTDIKEIFEVRWRYRGVFGLSLGGEVLLYFILSLVGIAFAILAVLLGKYFWWWIAAAVLVGPISWWRFWKRWKRWSAGRGVLDCLADSFGLQDEDGAPN